MLNDVRISGKTTIFNNVSIGRGSQILRLPGGKISNLNLASGAPYDCKFCDLRGGVLKYHQELKDEVNFDFAGLTVPCGWVVMDFFSFTDIRLEMAKEGQQFPLSLYKGLSGYSSLFDFAMIPARFSHPSESLFIPYFTRYTDIDFHGNDIGEHRKHGEINNRFLYLKEGKIKGKVTPSEEYQHIIISLIQGGSVVIKG